MESPVMVQSSLIENLANDSDESADNICDRNNDYPNKLPNYCS